MKEGLFTLIIIVGWLWIYYSINQKRNGRM